MKFDILLQVIFVDNDSKCLKKEPRKANNIVILLKLTKMEIAAFLSGGIVALAGKAMFDTVTTPSDKTLMPPPPPPPPPPMQKRKPKVMMYVNRIPAGMDLSQSYFGAGRCEKETEGIPINNAPAVGMSKSSPPFIRDPNLVNTSRLKHVETVKVVVPERNASEICRLLELGKTKLKSAAINIV